MSEFVVVPGPAVQDILSAGRADILALTERVHRAYDAGDAVNPPSCFLRFPGKPDARIIALPAFVGDTVRLAGAKWISSFPSNTARGVPRASGVLILNDYGTGRPVACLEAAGISAARTGASAALAARALRPGGRPGGRPGASVGVVGAGVIARSVCAYLSVAGCRPGTFVVHDRDEGRGRALADLLSAPAPAGASTDASAGGPAVRARFTPDLARALACETVVFATTAGQPYVRTPLRPGQLVLHISLRDLAPEVLLDADNFLDDIDHCLTAGTSPHLAEQRTGGRDFVTGTLADVLGGRVRPAGDRPVVFSPFGLGVLDIAVGAYVLDRAREAGTAVGVPDFFAEGAGSAEGAEREGSAGAVGTAGTAAGSVAGSVGSAGAADGWGGTGHGG